MSTTETFSAGQSREFYGDGDFFRLLTCDTPAKVEYYKQGREIAEAVNVLGGYGEYFRDAQFDRVVITSVAAQTIQFVTRMGSDVRYDRGAATISGTVALDSATLAALEQINVRPEVSTGSYKTQATLAANTSEQIFSPGSNVNGAILLSGGFVSAEAATHQAVFIAKSTAPTTVTDGEVFSHGEPATASGPIIGRVPQNSFVAAGLGLYFISNVAQTMPSGLPFRSARYKLL